MDINQLQTFDLIVRLGSFSKAARALNLAQPTVTARMHALEQELGTALFQRGGSRLTLTSYGRTYLSYVHKALDLLAEGRVVAQETVDGKRGTIFVGTLPTFSHGLFLDIILKFRSLYPNVNVFVHTGHNQELLEMLYDGKIAVGFLTSPFYNVETTEVARLKEPLVYVVNASHPLSKKGDISIDELVEFANPLIVVDWSIESKVRQLQIQSSVNKTAGQLELPPQAAYAAVLSGSGAALLTMDMVTNDLTEGRLVELDVEEVKGLSREIAVVRKNNNPSDRIADEFLRVVHEVMNC